MEENLTVNLKGGVFSCRAGAIIIDSGEILLVKNSGSSFYYTVGGRVKFGETSRNVIIREAYEETQLNLEIDRLAFIHENFFISNENGQQYHEICFFFLMKPNNLLRAMKNDSFEEEYGNVTLHWLPLNKLDEYEVYPSFLDDVLASIPNQTTHIITRAGETIYNTNK